MNCRISHNIFIDNERRKVAQHDIACDEIGEIAKRHGIKITWVGPPTTRQDESNRSSLQKFDEDMKAAVAPYGSYVSSAPFTPKYSGGDGIHYSGDAAKQWAAGVAGAV